MWVRLVISLYLVRTIGMANCKDCGKELNFVNKASDTLCVACDVKANINKKQSSPQTEASSAFNPEIAKVLVTTETVTSFKISKRIDVVTSQAAFEINNFKDIVVGFMNPIKGRANEMEKQIDLLKDKAMYDLKAKAHQLNANGVVGVDLDISTVTIGQISMLMLVASGTAVVIEE